MKSKEKKQSCFHQTMINYSYISVGNFLNVTFSQGMSAGKLRQLSLFRSIFNFFLCRSLPVMLHSQQEGVTNISDLPLQLSLEIQT